MAITKPDDLLAAAKADRNCVARAWERTNHALRETHVPKDGSDPVVRVTIDDSDLSLILAEFSRLGRTLAAIEQREDCLIASQRKVADEWMARALKAEAEAAAYRAAILSEAGQPAHDPEWWTVDRVVSLAKAHASDSIQADAFEESRDKAEAERGDINRMMDLAEIAEDPCVPCRVAACVTALNAARSDLAINAKLLSRQMDLARQAEIEARDARAEAAHYQELWKCRDDECRDLRDEIKRCQKSTGTFRRTLLAVRDRYRAGDTIEAIAADYDWLPEDVVELLDGLIPD